MTVLAHVNFKQGISSVWHPEVNKERWNVSLKNRDRDFSFFSSSCTDHQSISTTPLPGTNSSSLCSSEFVSSYVHLRPHVSIHVYVSCVDPIISLALLSSPVCLRRALCLPGAARPPKRLLQPNHFKT